MISPARLRREGLFGITFGIDLGTGFFERVHATAPATDDFFAATWETGVRARVVHKTADTNNLDIVYFEKREINYLFLFCLILSC